MGQLSAREGGHDGDDGGDMMKVSPDHQAQEIRGKGSKKSKSKEKREKWNK